MSIIPEKLRETADSAVSVILKGQRQRIQKQQRQQRIQKNQQKQPEDPNQAYLMGVLQGRVPKDPKTSLVALLRYFGYDAIMDAGMVFMNKKPNTIYLDRGIEQFCFSEHTYFKKIGQKYRPMYLVNNFDEALQHYGNLFLKAKSG